jgi:type I restriction enzyme R subunit
MSLCGWNRFRNCAGEREVQKALRKVIYVKYQVKDQDLFEKAFGNIRQYY